VPVARIIIAFTLLFIFIQDVKSRAVYWVLFPILTIALAVAYFFQYNNLSGLWYSALINIGFLLLQLLLVSAYFSLRNRKVVNVTKGLIGWGDILFLLGISVYLSVLNFLFFYIISLIIVLIFWSIRQRLSVSKSKEIPLAGIQALLFFFFLLGDWWLKAFSVADDTWLLNLIAK
jgi:hypothetical protein